MRSLNFFAMGQNLQKDPTCDFTGLVRGSKGYLQACFSFDAEWNGCGKVAVFTRLGKEYAVKLSADTCMIPEEALPKTLEKTLSSFRLETVRQFCARFFSPAVNVVNLVL